MEKNRVWLYCRTAQNDLKSMETQKRELVASAANQGFSVVGISGDMQSSRVTDRPGLLEVRKAVQENRTDIVLVSGIDRIYRSVAEMIWFREFLYRYGVRLFTVSGGEVNL